jgi:hypothetical protein
VNLTSTTAHLRIVILDRPVAQPGNARAAALLLRVMDLRRRGYGAEHAGHVLSFDATDLYGTHIAICHEYDNGELVPLAVLKSITLEMCEQLGMPLPIVPILAASSAPEALLAVERVIGEYRDASDRLAYAGSWTVLPECRGSIELLSLILVAGMNWYRSSKAHWIAAGALRFKTDQRMRMLGCEPITGMVNNRLLGDEPMIVMRHREYSRAALGLLEAHQSSWEDAVWLLPPDVESDRIRLGKA